VNTVPRWLVLLLVVTVAAISAAAISGPERSAVTQRAAMSGAPTIVWGTPIGHADRGPCTSCHRIANRESERLPAITAVSPLPHRFRGVCNNCHVVEVSWILRLLPAAAMPNRAGPSTGFGWLVARLLDLGSDGE
jgi:hypothetical protein